MVPGPACVPPPASGPPEPLLGPAEPAPVTPTLSLHPAVPLALRRAFLIGAEPCLPVCESPVHMSDVRTPDTAQALDGRAESSTGSQHRATPGASESSGEGGQEGGQDCPRVSLVTRTRPGTEAWNLDLPGSTPQPLLQPPGPSGHQAGQAGPGTGKGQRRRVGRSVRWGSCPPDAPWLAANLGTIALSPCPRGPGPSANIQHGILGAAAQGVSQATLVGKGLFSQSVLCKGGHPSGRETSGQEFCRHCTASQVQKGMASGGDVFDGSGIRNTLCIQAEQRRFALPAEICFYKTPAPLHSSSACI